MAILRVTKMENKQKGSAEIVVLIAVVLVIGLLSFAVGRLTSRPSAEGVTSVSGSSTSDPTRDHFLLIDGAIKVATSSPWMSVISSGTCSLVADTSIAATSTGTATCATTGSQVGDQIFISLATTSTALSRQYSIIGTVAGSNSSTVRLLNLTGTAAVPSATNSFGSSTQYQILRSN